jgi:transposase
MDAQTLLANPDIIRLESFISEPSAVTIVVRSKQKQSLCPKCHQPSVSLHSHYRRKVTDLPWHNVLVKLQLNTRKFKCQNELCLKKIFCERLPEVVEAYARKTCRLDGALTWLAFALGGEAGARTAKCLRMITSGDTLLRMIRRASTRTSVMSSGNEPKVIGVDDWAWRKGCTYGTIVVDLERRKVIDLLPDREAGTLTDWLLAHPTVETVARDRSITYRNGIMMGRPYATQVADRWHLLSNLGDALETMIERLLRQRKRIVRGFPDADNLELEATAVKRTFEALDDGEWQHALEESFAEMKRQPCRRRLLPHLPALMNCVHLPMDYRKTFYAVREATVSPWSNGQTEGQVNRLKLLKRQMYGRAKFDLLKARVINPA